MTHSHADDQDGYAGQSEKLLTEPVWRVLPVKLSSDGTRLLTDYRARPKPRARLPSSGLLTAFCQLARDGLGAEQRRRAILRFAQQYGLLGLCEKHHVPAAGCPDRCASWEWGPDDRGGFGTVDAVRDWILWARRFDGTVRLARAINKAQQPRPADVENAFAELHHWGDRKDLLRDPNALDGLSRRYVLADGSEELLHAVTLRGLEVLPNGTEQDIPARKWKRSGPAVEAFQLRQWLNELLTLAAVKRQVIAGNRQMLAITDAFAESCPLFGTLVVELIGECTGVASQARCANPVCQRGFKPNHQNQRYCRICRRDGVPVKLAQQRLRNERRARGLSARGRPLRHD